MHNDIGKKTRSRLRMTAIALAVLVVLSVVLESAISWNLNFASAKDSTSQLLDQVESVLTSDTLDEESQTEDLKDTYVSYAKTVGYILDAKPSAIEDRSALDDIAAFMGIDEIHIFDSTGTIYAGTVPAYYGYSFDSGEQMGYFKPMLSDKSLSMCQDVTPNTAEGKSMMYAIAWDPAGNFMVQVGVEPKRLLAALKDHELSNVISKVPLPEGLSIYAIDPETSEVTASTNEEAVGTNAADSFGGIFDNGSAGGEAIWNDGKAYYCSYKQIEGSNIVVAYHIGSGASGVVASAMVILVYMLIAAIIVYMLARKLLIANEERALRTLELEDRQAQLEEATAEQGTQIEEISALNEQLADVDETVANAGLGMWHIILKDGCAPRMKANWKMLEILGIPGRTDMSEEEVYAWWWDRITPDAIPSVNASVGEMLDGKFSENTYLWEHPTKGLIYTRCGGTCTTLSDGTHLVRGYHGDVTDIVLEDQRQKEELAKARAAAEAANDAKTSFLFNMSHDIRTPMNAIIGFTELLRKHQDDPQRCEDYLDKIQGSSQMLLNIINNVLDMARIERGAAKVEETAWSIEQFNDSLYSVFEEMMGEKGIDFVRAVKIEHDYVYCDVTKLSQVFNNILSNAYKYTNPGGRIELRLEEIPSERDGYATYRTTISDTGIGMDADFLPHLFEEFSREYTSTESKIQGTGLGMPIVKRLVDLMEGTIEVESTKGIGSTFVVTLPLRIADKSVLTQVGDLEFDPTLFEGKRILLAEDNDLNAEIAMEILSEAGFVVDRAEDGVVAVRMLADAPMDYYDVVLMDVQMPNMNGYEATREIRAMGDTSKANIPIFAMTANAFDEDKRMALREGMNGHIAKPIDVAMLMKALASVLA